MFTGIIEELGRVREIEKRGEDARIVIEARTVTEGSSDGDSIAVNGVCLTALDVKSDSFAADVSKETLFRSTLGGLRTGAPVNLERAVTPATRLGGHIVQGHVDARGKFLGAENHGDSWTFRFSYPNEIARYLVFKGSIAVEGVSLTIAELTDEYFEIAVIPKTLELTNFSHLQPGDEVNLEADVIAKYLERMTSGSPTESARPMPAILNRARLPQVFFLAIILVLLTANWFLFGLFHQKYFLWYLNNGPVISLAAGFLALTWTSMKARIGLVSSNPAAYIGACLQVLGVFFYSLAPTKSSAAVAQENADIDIGLDDAFVKVFDNVIYIFLALVMAVLSLCWVIFVAPLAYFVTLIAGVPARQALRKRIASTYIDEDRGHVNLIDPPGGPKPAGKSSDLSFARDPFATTQAVSSLVLFAVKIVYSRFG